jgi:hypothetical protein
MFENEIDNIDGTKWYNRYNGDCLIINSTLIDENGDMEYTVTDKNGNRKNIKAEMLNDYIQSDEPLIIPRRPEPRQLNLKDLGDDSITNSTKHIAPGLEHQFTGVHENLFEQPFFGNDKPMVLGSPDFGDTWKLEPKSPNQDIIERALKKATKPSIKNSYNWDDFPRKELDMLIDIMDVPEEEIIEYLTSDRYINECIGDIRNELKEFIKCSLMKVKRIAKIQELVATQDTKSEDAVEEVSEEVEQKPLFEDGDGR